MDPAIPAALVTPRRFDQLHGHGWAAGETQRNVARWERLDHGEPKELVA